MIHIALIHPQPIYRKGLSLMLTKVAENLLVVASTQNLRELINQYRNETIDVIVWDIPSHHVLTPGARLLKECFPLAKILVLVNSKNAVYAGLLETLGANIVLPADCEISHLHQTILEIHQTYAPPPSSNHVQEPSEFKAKAKLDQQELLILKLLGDRLSITQIATRIKVSKTEVTSVCQRLKRKFEVSNLAALLEKSAEMQGIRSTTNQSKL